MEVYDSARSRHPLVEEISALIRYRDLVAQFVTRSIKTRYKRSILGVLWTMMNPLLTMIVLTVVFSTLFKGTIKSVPVYILSGLVAWSFFSFSTSQSMSEMMWSGGLLGRIYVPKSIFPVSALGTALVNLLLSLIPLFLISLVLGVRITPAVLIMPLGILLLMMFALGIGLIMATAVVFFADMLPIYEVLLTLWMYTTPIIYPIDIIAPNIQWAFKLNPLYHLILVFRKPLYEGVVPSLTEWLIAAGIALVTLLAGGFLFTSKSNEYAYRI